MKQVLIFGSFLFLALASCETNDVPFPEPSVSLSLDAPVISEDQGVATLTATLSNPAEQEVVVTLAVSGTASSGDYSLSALSIVISSNSLTGSVTVEAVQDSDQEGNETVLISIEAVTGAKEEGEQEVSLTIEDDDVAMQLNLVLNEICYDPSNSGLDGDTNGDGVYAQQDDEFLELVNLSSSSLDMSGFMFFDEENLAISTPNHTVPAGTIIPAGGVYLLFGGGTPTGSFGGAIVQTTTFGELNLNNAGDKLYIQDASGNEVLTFDIEPLSNNPNESYTRNPDLTGDFVQHSVANPGVLWSPGTKVDGSPF